VTSTPVRELVSNAEHHTWKEGNVIRKTVPLATLAMVVLIGAGCSSGRSGGSNTTAAYQEKAVKFAQCMRENGISEFPDPDASGDFTIDAIANGSSVDPSTPAFDQAISACKDLEPAGFTGHTRSAEEQGASLRFAQCIRENGVADFPDPAPNAPLVDTNRIPSANTAGGMSILNAAMHKCGDVAAEAMRGQ
jgi:hypothetical protein